MAAADSAWLAPCLQARVGKVLAVWGDWFLFSESFIAGLRTTFLRRSDAGVPPFHTLPTTSPEDEAAGPEGPSAAEGDSGGAGLAAELRALSLAELERRCKHSGLSLRGGRAVMAARLLHLDEEEHGPRKGGPQEAHKAEGGQGGPSGGKVSRSRAAPTGQWQAVDPSSEPTVGWEQIGADAAKAGPDEGAAFASGILQIPEYEGSLGASSARAAGEGRPSSRQSLDKSESGAGGDKKKGRAEVVLPASKWAHDGGDSDDDDDNDNSAGGPAQGGQQQGAAGGAGEANDDDRRSSDLDIFEGAGKPERAEAPGASAELEEERR